MSLICDSWYRERVVKGKGPKRNTILEGPKEKAGTGARRELFAT